MKSIQGCILLIFFLLIPPISASDTPSLQNPQPHGNTTIQSFNKAKKILQTEIYPDHRITFYCGCPFNDKKQIIPSDKYTPKRQSSRSKRIEWDHIFPQLTMC